MSSTSIEPSKEPSECNYTNCLYCKWFEPHPSEQRRPLPEGRNCDGRPIWEPPIFCYSELIDEVHDKKREAVMKHFGGDRAKTTQFMDIDTENHLLVIYYNWLRDNIADAGERGYEEEKRLLEALWGELWIDRNQVEDEFLNLNMLLRLDDGQWKVALWSTKRVAYVLREEDSDDNTSSTFELQHELSAVPDLPHLNLDAMLNPLHNDDNNDDEQYFSASENSIHSPNDPLAEMQRVKPTRPLSFDEFDEDTPKAKRGKIDH